MNRIDIGVPRIVCGDKYTRLEADVILIFDGETIYNPIFFEVENEWGDYLVDELSDPFVLVLLELALQKRCDIYFKAPMSEDLKYQLEHYLIPVFSRKVPGMNSIDLCGEAIDVKMLSEGAVGTGFSAGVDSFYSVLSHIDSPYKSKKVTHLLLAVNGAAATGMTEELDKSWFEEEQRRFKPAAEKLGLKFVAVNSNVSLLSHYKKYFKGGSVIPTSGFVHALRKLFKTYYWASSLEADILDFNNSVDGDYQDPFTVPMVSVEGLRFYHSGCEVKRVEKVDFIAENPVAQEVLTVCGEPVSCGKCFKCLRTMAELNSVGKLNKFSKVFDVTMYQKHYSNMLAREFALDHPPFTTDIKESMKKHNVKIPVSAIIKAKTYFSFYYFLKKKLRNNLFFMKLYYEKGWSEKLGEGKRGDEIIRARLEGKGK